MEHHTYSNTPFFSLNNYNCWARLINVHDGDTITAIIEYPTNTFCKYNIRLDGIDTYEMTSHDIETKAKAILARNLLIESATCNDIQLNPLENIKITRNKIIEMLEKKVYLVFLKCKTMDKYGRVLADVYAPNNLDENNSLNNMMLNAKLAYEYHGGHKEA